MPAKTILVVDDEAHILHVVSLKLQNAGFNTITAADGDEGLEAALSSPVSADHHGLPDADDDGPGDGAADSQRAGQARPSDHPVDGARAGIEQVELAQAGIACCLSKPFSPREILGKVHGFLAESEKAPLALEP